MIPQEPLTWNPGQWAMPKATGTSYLERSHRAPDLLTRLFPKIHYCDPGERSQRK